MSYFIACSWSKIAKEITEIAKLLYLVLLGMFL
jgi:hypothetical protein